MSASELTRIRVSIVGAGNIAVGYDTPSDDVILTHAHAILNDNRYELLGIYDIDAEKAEKAAKKWKTNAYSSVEKCCSNADIICIAVPDAFHREVLENCLNNSTYKAIIIEKPLADTQDNGRSIVSVCKYTSVPIFVNYSRRYVKEFHDIKAWIDNDAGRLISGTCYYGKGVTHNASHLINLMQMYFDDIQIRHCGGKTYDGFFDDPSREIVLAIEEALIYFHPIPCNILTIFGFDLLFSNGRVRYIGDTETIEYYTIEASMIYPEEKNYCLKDVTRINHGSPMVNLYDNIVNVLDGEDSIHCGLEDAQRTLELCEEIKLWK